MKKILSILLVVMMLFALAACTQTEAPPPSNTGSNNTGNTGNNNTGNNTPDEPPEENYDPFGKFDPPVTLTTVRSTTNQLKFDPDNPEYRSLEENKWATKYRDILGVVFDYLWVIDESEYNQRWNLAIASNDIPDAAVAKTGIYATLLNGGYIEDMTDVFDKYASEEYKYAQERDGGITMKATTQGGRLMGLPHNGQEFTATPMLFIREDWLNKLGLSLPKTIGDVIDIARAFKEAKLGGENTYGMAANKQIPTGFQDLLGFVNGFGAYLNMWVEDGKGGLAYSTTQPQWRDALLALQSMYAEGLLATDFATMEWSQAGQQLAQNLVGLSYGSYPMPTAFITANRSMNPEAEWIVMPIVSVDGSMSRPQAMMSRIDNYVFVRKGIAHPEAVVKVINLGLVVDTEVDDDPNRDPELKDHLYKFGSGIERPGKNLDIHDDIHEAMVSGNPDNLTAEETNLYNSIMYGIETRENTFFMVYGSEPNSTFYIMKQNMINKNYVVNEFQGPYTDTMVEHMGILDQSLNEAMFAVMMGGDISIFDNAVELWYSGMGGVITQEVNEWYANSK